MKRKARWVVVAVAAMILLVLGVGAAQAATWGMTRPIPTGSSMTTTGTMTFTGAKSFQYNGGVTDICPPDGFGGSIFFHMDGPDEAITDIKIEVSSGCGTSKYGSGSVQRSKTISAARVIPCATGDGSDCWITIGPGVWKDNPHV